MTCTVSIFAGDDFCAGRTAEKQREKKISNSLKEQITIIIIIIIIIIIKLGVCNF